MNQVAVQLNAFTLREEMPRAAAADRRQHLVCPKPRRLGLINTTVNDNPFRHNFDSDALDLLFFKDGCGLENYNPSSTQSASTPPYLCGSPPSRVANPLILDARFGDKTLKVVPIFSSAEAPPPSSTPPSSAGRKDGRVRSTFCNNPAVRIEGFEFDCRLDREMQNRSITALG